MGTSLTGLTPATTYDALIKVGDNGPIDATLKVLSDGLGNNLPMEASSTTINFTNQLQQSGVAVPTASQVNAKQDTLVSGTNIKTINGTSVLGAGNIVTPTTSPSGVSGAIQFSNGSAFASDASNFFWDNTNKRLGIGTSAPSNTTEIQIPSTYGAIGSNANLYLTSALTSAGIKIGASGSGAGCTIQATQSGGGTAFNLALNPFGGSVNVGNSNLGASFGIKGSGSTSATTSLLVQNSAGTNASFQVKDDGNTYLGQFNTPSGNNALDQFTSKLFTLTSSVASHSIGSTYNGSTGDTSLALCGLGTSGGFFGGIRFFTSRNSATPILAMIVDRNQNVGIGLTNSTDLTTNTSAKLQVDSTVSGFLPPRMTTTQKNAIATPASGLVVYDTTTNKLCCYNGSTWNDLF